MLYDFGPRLLKLRKDKNLTQQMVVERAKGFDPNLRLFRFSAGEIRK